MEAGKDIHVGLLA